MRGLSRGLVLGLLVVVGLAVAPGPSSGDAGTTSSGTPGDAAEPVTENADLEDYSTAYGVSPVQARLEWEATDLAGELQVALIDAQVDVFGGLWVEHLPSFAIVVGVLPGGEKAIREHVDRLGLATVTRIHEAKFTLAQLRRDQASLDAVAPFGVDFASGIDQSMGRVEVYVESESDVAAFENASLPESVVVIQEGLPTPTADVYGGLSLSNGCTSGFSVEETGSGTREGVTTAGHCSNTTSYNGVDLPWQDGMHSGSVDAQWHTTPGLTDPNKIRVSSSGTTRNVTSRKPLNQMVEGEHVCKYGRTTLYDCGEITDTYYNPTSDCINAPNATHVRVTPNPNAGDMAEDGDSGDPVFHDNPAKAYGMGFCEFEPGGDMVFMPQNFLPDIGVQVDID
jgi:hypothetical protein